MRTIMRVVLIPFVFLAGWAVGEEDFSSSPRWDVRFDIGGSIPQNPSLSEIAGPVTGGDTMELSAGMQFDISVGYRVTPWLAVEGELGFIFNEVESVGNWSYPDSALNQMLLMANVVVEYPRGRFVPFAGVGAGGVLSSISFGNHYDYYWYGSDSDGSGSDFVPAVQALGGVRYEFNEQWNVGLVYRFLATDSQEWDVEWWNGPDFRLGVDRVCIHSICLAFSGRF